MLTHSAKRATAAVTALLLVLSLLLTGCGEAKKAGTAPQGSEYTVALSDITSSITGTATIQPLDQYSVSALVSGEVMSAPFEEGDMNSTPRISKKTSAVPTSVCNRPKTVITMSKKMSRI